MEKVEWYKCNKCYDLYEPNQLDIDVVAILLSAINEKENNEEKKKKISNILCFNCLKTITGKSSNSGYYICNDCEKILLNYNDLKQNEIDFTDIERFMNCLCFKCLVSYTKKRENVIKCTKCGNIFELKKVLKKKKEKIKLWKQEKIITIKDKNKETIVIGEFLCSNCSYDYDEIKELIHYYICRNCNILTPINDDDKEKNDVVVNFTTSYIDNLLPSVLGSCICSNCKKIN